MANEIAMSTDFQTRIFEKIKKDIGELMTDAEVKALVDKAMEKAFFERQVLKDNYGRDCGTKPSVIELLVKELLDSAVRASVSRWLEEHPEEVAKVVDGVLRDGIVGIVSNHIRQRTEWPLQELASKLMSKGILS
jgi:hypothetical protein